MPVEIRGIGWATAPSLALGDLAPPFTGHCSHRAGPTPHSWSGRAGSSGMGQGELALPLTWGGWSQWSRSTFSVPTQTHILGLVLAHPHIFPIQVLLEHGKGLVLWNNSLRISMTRSNIRISAGIFGCQYLDDVNGSELISWGTGTRIVTWFSAVLRVSLCVLSLFLRNLVLPVIRNGFHRLPNSLTRTW